MDANSPQDDSFTNDVEGNTVASTDAGFPDIICAPNFF
jgi:hypothetical protein